MNKNKKQKNIQPENTGMTSILIQLSIVVLAFILYGKTINYGFTLDDDLFYVKHKTVLQGVSGIPQLFKENSLFGFFGSNNIDDVYRPVTLSSFSIQKQMVGVSAKASHFFNILVYALAGLVLFSVLKKLFTNWSVLICGIIALLFIAHPIHTEVVCSVKSRDEILSCLFGFLFLRSILVNQGKTGLASYLLPCTWIALALFTKESSITFIGLAPLVIYFKEKQTIKQLILRTLPFVMVAGIFLLIRSQVLTGETDASRGQVIYNALNGATNFNDLYGSRLYILLLFLKQSLFPYFMSWDYSYNQVPLVNLTNPWAIFSIVLHIGLIAVTIFFVRKRDPIAFGLLFFFITSSITNNFILKIGATFAERFLFIPALGMLIALVGGIFYLMKINPQSLKLNTPLKLIFTSLFIFYSGLTLARVPVWENNYTLYQSGILTAPNSARAQAAMASEYRLRAEQATTLADRTNLYEKAKFHYTKSTKILPSYAESYYNLGIIEYSEQDTLSALNYYKQSLTYTPSYKNSLHNLGVIYLLQNKLDSSLVYLNKLMEFYPNENMEYINLSYLFLLKKDYEKVKMYANKGLEKDPNNPAYYRNLAAAYNEQGDTTLARQYWQKFLDLGGKP